MLCGDVAAITRAYGRDVIDVTTRQQVQLRWMTIADVPDILSRLHAVGLTTMQTGLDNSRNVVGCPPEDIAVGMPVQVTWEELSDGRHLPLFEPVGG